VEVLPDPVVQEFDELNDTSLVFAFLPFESMEAHTQECIMVGSDKEMALEIDRIPLSVQLRGLLPMFL
jgi:hypothetical protein